MEKKDNNQEPAVKDYLQAIICGPEHSGTTMLLEILKKAPTINSGFEGGFLLCNTPKDFINFEPFYTNFLNGYSINENQIKEICDTNSFAEAYKRLIQISPVLENTTKIIDKTPRYLRHLRKVLLKTPDVPCVVLVRDPRAFVWSICNRETNKEKYLDHEKLSFDEWMVKKYQKTIWYLSKCYEELSIVKSSAFKNRIMIVPYELFVLSPEKILPDIFKHCNLEFKKEYMCFGENKNKLVYGNLISADYIYDYKKNLSEEVCNEIKKKFEKYDFLFLNEEKNSSTLPNIETKDIVKAFICGFEGGGTTLISEIIKMHPSIESGFEGGFLLCNTPRDFINCSPYAKNLKESWKISDSDLKYICDTDSWPETYNRLRKLSPIIKNKTCFLIDKTPRYMLFLDSILTKAPEIPCIVVIRDPRAVLWTHAKRTYRKAPPFTSQEEWAEMNVESFSKHYNNYYRGYKTALEKGLGKRILLIKHEDVCKNPEQEIKKVFDFIGLDFKPQYLVFDEKSFNYPTRGKEINNKFTTEYEEHLTMDTQQKLLRLTNQQKIFSLNKFSGIIKKISDPFTKNKLLGLNLQPNESAQFFLSNNESNQALLEKYFAKISIDPICNFDETTKKIRVGGVLVPKANNQAIISVFVRGKKFSTSGKIGLPSPVAAKQFPDNPYAKNSRFLVTDINAQQKEFFEIVACFEDGKNVVVNKFKAGNYLQTNERDLPLSLKTTNKIKTTEYKPIENLFLCVGSQKAGTTWLYVQLKNHPEIGFSSKKEVHYFDKISKKNYFSSEFNDSWYTSLATKTNKKYFADFTPSYAVLPSSGYENINKICVNKKIIFIMRDPIERAKSAMRYYFETKQRDIKKVPLKELIKLASSRLIIGMSSYENTIQKLEKHFLPNDVLYLFYEDMMQENQKTLDEITRFLGVSQIQIPKEQLERKINTTHPFVFTNEIDQILKSNLKKTYSKLKQKFSYIPPSWNT
jgi:hypothetical protein